MSGHSAASAFSRPDAPSTTTSSGLGNPRRMRSSSSARQAASLSFPAHGLDRQQHLLAVRPHAERDEKRDRGRLPVEPNARDSAVEDQPDDRLLGERAPIPGIPIGLHLAPGPADHVLADRPGERRGKRPPHPAGVGSER